MGRGGEKDTPNQLTEEPFILRSLTRDEATIVCIWSTNNRIFLKRRPTPRNYPDHGPAQLECAVTIPKNHTQTNSRNPPFYSHRSNLRGQVYTRATRGLSHTSTHIKEKKVVRVVPRIRPHKRSRYWDFTRLGDKCDLHYLREWQVAFVNWNYLFSPFNERNQPPSLRFIRNCRWQIEITLTRGIGRLALS